MRLSSLILLAVSVYTANVNSWPLFSLTDPSIEIKNVLSHYCIILDTKTYSDLSQIYTSDAVANFSTIGLGVLSGLPAIESAMNASLFGIPTQHAMTTSYISGVDSHSANATTYYSLEQFGTGSEANTLFTVWGKWVDQLVHGSDGWRVQNRQVVAMGGPLIGNFTLPTH